MLFFNKIKIDYHEIMKRLQLITLVLLFGGHLFAQKVSFCEALPLLEKYATNEFSEIRSGLDSSQTFPTTYFSSMQIKEALSSKVTQSIGPFTFTADFGEFNSREDALLKIMELSASLYACYPGIKLTTTTEKIFKTESHTLALHNQDGFRLYDAKIKLSNFKDKYYLSFDFDASEKKNILNKNPSQAYTDFQLIKLAADQSDFSVSIRRVIEEAKNGFKSIKAEEIESPDYFSHYGVKYKVQGYDCYIEDRTMEILFYVIPKVKSGTEESFSQSVADITRLIELALGTDYGSAPSSNGQSIVYVNKNQPEKKVLTLLLTFDDKHYEMDLQIHNLE